MKHKGTKALICAVAMSMLLTGSSFQSNAANGLAASLPAAGLGLAMSDGSSVKDIRDDVKNKKGSSAESSETKEETAEESSAETETAETKAEETQSAAETETESESKQKTEETQSSQDTERETETGTETQTALAETETETQTQESRTAAEEKEIVEAVEPVIKEPEIKLSDEEIQQEEEKETLIIAQVNDYVNIRSTPSTESEIVGKLYNNSVGVLIKEEDGWYQMKSGNVEGYVKAEYFETGDEAKRIADEVGNRIATVNTQTLKVRYDASLEAPVLGLVPGGEELTVLDEQNGFVKVSIEEGDGWVSMDYVILETEYVTAESVAEEKARLEAEQKAKEEARKAAAAAEAKIAADKQKKEAEQKAKEQQAAAESGQDSAQQVAAKEEASAPVVSTGSGLGSAVANYAVQFVGNPYVYGGTSLTNGADCSGFVMSVYKNFGVSLPHSSSADRYVGYSVGSLSEAQPGDLVCYSGHVGIYIGGGQIVHASTAATGIKISNANYRTPVAIRRIF